MAAAGHAEAKAYPQPQLAIRATGDALLLPGPRQRIPGRISRVAVCL